MDENLIIAEHDPFAGPRLEGLAGKELSHSVATGWMRKGDCRNALLRAETSVADAVDPEQLRQCVDSLLLAYAGLRSFVSVSADWRLVAGDPSFEIRELGDSESPDEHASVDPEHGPLLNVFITPDGASTSRICLVTHHAVCDEFNLHRLLLEVLQRYEGSRRDEADASSHVAVPAAARSAELFLDLPAENCGSNDSAESPGTICEDLPPGTLSLLRQVAVSHETDFETVLRETWACYLGVLNSYEDFDLAFSSRAPQPGDAPNLLAISRYALRPEDTLGALLEDAASRHADYLEPPLRSAERLFSIQPSLLESQRNVQLRALPPGSCMHVRATVWGEDESLQCDYDPTSISASTAERRLAGFARFLARCARDPGARISTIDLLTSAQREEVDLFSRGPQLDVPSEASTAALIAGRAAAQPQSVAIVCDDEEVSYDALWQAVQRCASALASDGIEPGAAVAVLLEQSPEYIVSILALLQLGCTYVPLDPKQPARRLGYICADAGVAAVIVGEPAEALVATLPRQIVFGDLEVQADAPRADGDAPAYVLYTSGSTGNPKGVAISRRSLLHHNLAIIDDFGIEPSDTVLQFANPVFDVAVEEIFPTLVAGATVLLMPDKAQLSIAEFDAFVRDSGVTVLNLPANYWHEWVRYLKSNGSRVGGNVRLVVAGSDRVSPDVFRTWRQIASDTIAFRNGYGPTESTVTATLYDPEHGSSASDTVPIGRPVANVQAMVVRECLPMPIGVRGELLLGGPQLADGYLGRDDLSAAVFVQLDLGGGTQRWYRTGDEVRMLDDGNLEFLGRIDHQVKVNGFRVELGEVERVIETVDDVSSAVAAVSTNPAGVASLSAYYTTESGREIAVASLRDSVAGLLPPYMVPAHWMWLPEMPMTPSGKVDRKGLPKIEASRPELINPLVAPSNALERRLSDIWKSELGLDAVGVLDNFFELGGTSLAGLRIIEEINRDRSSPVTAAQFFQNPTVSRLAEFLGAAEQEPPASAPSRRGTQQRAAVRNNAKWRRRQP